MVPGWSCCRFSDCWTRTWSVGDLGCGTGHFALAAAPFVRQVIAVDGSPEMLDVARTRLAGVTNVDLRNGSLESLPIDDGALDLGVLSVVLGYAADPLLVLQEAARVLKPGGRLLIVDLEPHDQVELRQRYGQSWQGFDEGVLRGWLEAAGFTALRRGTLPAEPRARGPMLFVATARAPQHHDHSSPERAIISRSRT